MGQKKGGDIDNNVTPLLKKFNKFEKLFQRSVDGDLFGFCSLGFRYLYGQHALLKCRADFIGIDISR